MEDLFRPSAERGAKLYVDLRSRLADSLRHIAEASRAFIQTDTATVELRCAVIEETESLRPDLFLIYHDLLDAARRSDVARVESGFAELLQAPLGLSPTRVRNYADGSFAPAELDRYHRAFADLDDGVIELVPAEPRDFTQACTALAGARSALCSADPEHAGEVFALVKEVVFATGKAGEGMTFDGVTSFPATGSLLLNAAEHRTVPGAFAGLVHESAHALMFAHARGEGLVENPLAERYPSPLRPDPRPMDGIFHAAFVSARVAYALGRALDAGAFAPPERDEAGQLLAGARAAWGHGYDTLRRHGRPTPLGQTLLQSAAEHMA